MPDGDSLKSQMGLDVADMLKSLGAVTAGFSSYNQGLGSVNTSMKGFNSLAAMMIADVNALAKAWNAVATAATRAATNLSRAHGTAGLGTGGGIFGAATGGRIAPSAAPVAGNLLGMPTAQILANMQGTAAATAQAAGAAGTMGKNVANAAGQVNIMHLSWQSIARLVTVQLIRRAVSALLAALKQSITEAKDLMIRVAEIQTIDPKEFPFRGWISGLRELSDSWGLDVIDQAKGAYETLSNQIAFGADALFFLEQANRFAVTSITSVGDAVKTLTGVMNAYGIAAEDTFDVSAKLFKTIELGRVRGSEMTALGSLAVMADQAGISLNELTAAFDIITIKGVPPAKAMTELRNIMNQILKPSEKLKDFLDEIGVSSIEAAMATYRLQGFLGKLFESTGGRATEVAGIFKNIRGRTGVMALMGDDLNILQENIDKTANAFEDYSSRTDLVMMNTGKLFEIELNKIKNYFLEDFGIAFIERFRSIFGGFSTLTVAVKTFATAMLVTLLPALTMLLSKLGKIVAASSALTKELLVIGAIAVVWSTISSIIEEVAKAELATWTRNLDEQTERLEKNIIRQNNIIQEAAKKRLQLQLNWFAAERKEAHKNLQDQIHIWDTSATKFKLHQDFIIDIYRDHVNDLKKEMDRVEKFIKDTPGDIAKMQIDMEKTQFKMRLDDTYIDDKIKLIGKRINDLVAKAKQAVVDRDTTSFDALWKDILNLQGEAGSIAKELGVSTESFIKRLTDLQAQYFQDRKDFAKSEKEHFKEMQAEYMAARLVQIELESEYKKILDFKPSEAAKLKPEEMKKSYDEVAEAFNKVGGILVKVGGDPSVLAGRKSEFDANRRTAEDKQRRDKEVREISEAAKVEEKAQEARKTADLKNVQNMRDLNKALRATDFNVGFPYISTKTIILPQPEVRKFYTGNDSQIGRPNIAIGPYDSQTFRSDFAKYIGEFSELMAKYTSENHIRKPEEYADLSARFSIIEAIVRAYTVNIDEQKMTGTAAQQVLDLWKMLETNGLLVKSLNPIPVTIVPKDEKPIPIPEDKGIVKSSSPVESPVGVSEALKKYIREHRKEMEAEGYGEYIKRTLGETTSPEPFKSQTRAPSKDISFIDYRNQPQLAGISIVINESGTPQQTAYAVGNELVRMSKQGTIPLAIGRA